MPKNGLFVENIVVPLQYSSLINLNSEVAGNFVATPKMLAVTKINATTESGRLLHFMCHQRILAMERAKLSMIISCSDTANSFPVKKKS